MVPFKDRLFLVVAGQVKHRDGKDGNYYKKLAAELGLEGTVLWRLEYIPNDEVPNYFEMCDWVAMPYSGRFTSQSGVLNVAMAHHRPVLVTATPTIVETFEIAKTGILAVPDDLDDLIVRIGEMLSLPLHRLFDNIPRYLAEFSWEKNCAITAEVYQQVALGI
jgi:glycosyltransferase involved in cell wall biosynthesis